MTSQNKLQLCQIADAPCFRSRRNRSHWSSLVSLLVILTTIPGCNESADVTLCKANHIDLGTVYSPNVGHTFQLRNDTSQSIEITELRKSCTCTVPRLSKNIMRPGESAELEMTVEVVPKMEGANVNFSQRVLVVFRDTGRPPEELWLSGVYIPAVYVPSRVIRYTLADMQLPVTKAKQHVLVAKQTDVRLKRIECNGNLQIDASFTDRPIGETDTHDMYEVDLRISAPDASDLPSSGQISIFTTDASLKPITISALVYDNEATAVSVEPENVTFGVLDSSGTTDLPERVLRVSYPPGKSYELVDLSTDVTWLTAACATAESNDTSTIQPVILRVEKSLSVGPLVGTVSFRIIDRTSGFDKHIVVPASGFCRPQR